MKSAVLGYLKSNVQPDVYSEYIDNLMEPAAIMEMLQSLVLRTTATTFEETLTLFNNLQYDPASQDIVEFNARFNKLRSMLRNHPNNIVLTPGYVRLRYLSAISTALPLLYQRETNPHSNMPRLELHQLQEQAVQDQRFAPYAARQSRENSQRPARPISRPARRSSAMVAVFWGENGD